MNKFVLACRFVIEHEWLNWIPDVPYLHLLYWAYMGKRLNLKNPVTYNEKLQWLKVHDRNDIYTAMVDKYEAKRYVAKIIGNQYIIPTLGVWNCPEDIEFDRLPDRFVLKSTHDSGGVMIIDKTIGFDRSIVNDFFNKRLSQGTWYRQREWPYKNVVPRIIAEEYLEDNATKELRDYKFLCFKGMVKALYIVSGRNGEENHTALDFFDSDFRWLDVRKKYPNASKKPEKPLNYELMKKLASELSAGFAHLRVDLYEVNGRIYFGELTFFPSGGILPFDPEEWDYKFGELIDLNVVNVGKQQ